MSGIVYFLLFLWSIVQTTAFWFPAVTMINAIKDHDGNLLFLSIFMLIIVNLIVGFISIFVLGQFHKDEEKKHFFFKSAINGLCGSIRLPMHIIIRIIAIFNSDLPLDWGCYDGDNWVSILIYSATLLDIEPSWGDFPDRDDDHESRPRYIRKARGEIAKDSHHALHPYVTENDGKVHGPSDVLAQARSIASFCSTYVEKDGNVIDIDFGARLSGNTIFFAINVRQTKSKGFSSQYALDSFQNMVVSTIDSKEKQITELMQKYAANTTFDREYSVQFEKGKWNF